MGRRIKDRSWRIETKRFVGEPCGLRVVEPNGKYLILEKFENFSGERKRSGIPDLYKINLNEGGGTSTRLIEESDIIFQESWVKGMDFMERPRRQRFAENLWKDRHVPLYSPSLPYGNSMSSRHKIPYMSIDDGTHVLAAAIKGEKGTADERISRLFVRPFSKGGLLKEIDLECPEGVRRNCHADAPRALGTLHSEDTYAVIFEGKRVINVSRQGNQLTLNLNFGKVRGPAQLKWSTNWSLGLQSPSLWMGFTDDGSRLLTVSYLPYWNDWDNLYYSGERSTAFRGAFRWEVKSWDVDGRVSEIKRTGLRLEGKWKTQSERKSRSDALTKAGLPVHVARLISRHGLSNIDGISIFNHLREGGVPSERSTDSDPLKLIDELVFSRRMSAEDGRFLVENRNHVDLVTAIADGSRTLEWARWLLLDMGFSNHPEATSRVIAGADVETVAMVERITSAPRKGAAKQTRARDTEESNREDSDEIAEAEERPVWRRNNRFA